jgi:molybdate transport system substrate-binding protein
MRPRLPLALALCIALLVSAQPVRADTVLVAVAANFVGPFRQIAEAFTVATGHVVQASPGPTGKFYAQIATGGAPFEVLLAADSATPRRLLAEGHAVPGTAFTYAVGQLVLWSATPGVVDDQGAVLADPGRIQRLAIANPKVAPYGAAALEVLKSRGVADRWASRLVTGDSVAQAHQFVFTGNAELGFVALSQVAVPGRPAAGSWWAVPQSLYGEIRQDAVLLRAGAQRPAARALLQFLQSPSARQVIARHGYALPAP